LDDGTATAPREHKLAQPLMCPTMVSQQGAGPDARAAVVTAISACFSQVGSIEHLP